MTSDIAAANATAATATATQDRMDLLAREWLLPLMLLLNFALFQHLALVFARRWRELAVQQLLLAAALGFATLFHTPHDDLRVVRHLNDVSEDCVQLTFLLQITIIGRDVLARLQMRSIRVFLLIANALVVLDWLTIVLDLTIAAGVEVIKGVAAYNNVLETVTLLFVLVFRFYYLASASSWRAVRRDRKLELVLYVLFAVHEVPFAVLDATTTVDWEFVQGVCMRVLLAACVLVSMARKAQSTSRSLAVATRVSTTGGLYARRSAVYVATSSAATRVEETRVSVPRVGVGKPCDKQDSAKVVPTTEPSEPALPIIHSFHELQD